MSRLPLALLLVLALVAAAPAAAQAAPMPVKVVSGEINARGVAIGLKCQKKKGRCKGRVQVKDQSGATVARKRFRVRARRAGLVTARLTKAGRRLAKKHKLPGAAQAGGSIKLNVVIYNDGVRQPGPIHPFAFLQPTRWDVQPTALRCLEKGEWAAVGPDYAAYETYNFVPIMGGFWRWGEGLTNPRPLAIITSPTGEVIKRRLSLLNKDPRSALGVLAQSPGLDKILTRGPTWHWHPFGSGYAMQTAGTWTYQVVWEPELMGLVMARYRSNICKWEAATLPPQLVPVDPNDPRAATELAPTCPTATLQYGQQASGGFVLRSGQTELPGRAIKLEYIRDDVLQDIANVTSGGDGGFGFGFIPGAAGSWRVVATFAGDDANRPATATCSFSYQDNRLQPYFGLDQTCPHNAGIWPQDVNLGFQMRNDVVAMSGLSVTATWFNPGGGFHSQETLVTDADGSFNTAETLNGPGAWRVDLFYAGDNSNTSAAYSCTVNVAPHPP